jgi:hypothetical protein
MSKDKFIIFHIDGGFGKNIAATAVCKAIKNNYPDYKLIVVASYPEAFINLQCIDRVFRTGVTPYFYDDYINNKDVKIFRQEPYFAESHILQNKHLIETWCDIFDIEYSGENPELVFNKRELELAAATFNVDFNRPIFVFQTNGGADSQPHKYSWSRDISNPVAQQVVNNIQDALKDNAQIFHIRRENQLSLAKTIAVSSNNRNLCGLIALSHKRLLIDSFGQHAAAALNKPSVVCWIANTPKVFGYNLHFNFAPTIDKTFSHRIDSYLEEYEWTGSRAHECPFDTDNIFDPNQISQLLLQNI